MADIRQFTLDLEKFAKRVEVDAGQAHRKVALDLFSKIVRRTPVLTGRARMGWNLADGRPDFTVPPEGKYSEAEALADSLAFVPQPFGTIHITNAVPYIRPLEFGSSEKAGAGMVRISVVEIAMDLGAI